MFNSIDDVRDRKRLLDEPNLNPEQTFSTYYSDPVSKETILVDDGLSYQEARDKVEKYKGHGFSAWMKREVDCEDKKQPV